LQNCQCNETEILDLLIKTSVLCFAYQMPLIPNLKMKKDLQENQMVKKSNQLNAYD
jgi:hypothetical protein